MHTADPDVFDELARELGDTNPDTASLLPDEERPTRRRRLETAAEGQRVGHPRSALVGVGMAREAALADIDIRRVISPGWRDNTGGAELVIAYRIPDDDLWEQTIGKTAQVAAAPNRAARRKASRRGTTPAATDRHVAWLIGCATEVYLTRDDIDDPDHERIHPSGDTTLTVMPAIDEELADIFGVDSPEEACRRLFLRPGGLIDHSLEVMVHGGYIDDDTDPS